MAAAAPAVVFVRPGVVDVREVVIPEPESGEVRVRTLWSGISQGTERWMLTGRYDNLGAEPQTSYPAFPGYQAGRVEAVGTGVTGLGLGDPVMLQGTRFADPELPNPGPGLAAHVGLLVGPASEVVLLSADVDLAEASLFRMAAVARHGARFAHIGFGDVVVVIGLGMIGQMASQAARRRGARVIGADLVAARVEAAAAHCLQGYYPDPIPVQFHATHLKRVTVTFPCGWDGPNADAEIADDLAARRIAIEPLITHRVPFHAAPTAYDLLLHKPELTLGMVLDWAGADVH